MSRIFCDNCLEDSQPTVTLRQKGCDTINAVSGKLGDNITANPGQSVHKACRRDYCRQSELRRSGNSDSNLSEEYRRLRSNGGFDFELHCLFCDQTAKLKGNKRGVDVFPVRTLDFQAKIREECERRRDQWGNDVRARLEFAQDLPAADAIYHQSCSVNFRTAKQIPSCRHVKTEPPAESPKGRPENRKQFEAFAGITNFLEENEEEQVSVSDLVQKMDELYPDNAYSAVYMKKKLIEHYKDKIVITELNGVPNAVTFKTTASSILNDFYNQPKDLNASEKKLTIIKAAAKLLHNYIKEMPVSKETYPSPPDLSSLTYH